MECSWRVLSLLCLFHSAGSVPIEPPSLFIGPPIGPIYFGGGSSPTLLCNATGTPPIRYDWRQNGKLLNIDNGIYTVASPQDGSWYQCLASNQFGTAVSNVTILQAYQMPVLGVSRNMTAVEGMSFSIPCRSLDGGQAVHRGWFYKWQTVVSITDIQPRDLVLNDRMQIDETGNLYFASVQTMDSQSGRFYRCHMTNTDSNSMEISVGYTKLIVIPKPPGSPPPSLGVLFNHSWPQVAIQGRPASLRCFFGGASDIKISWVKPASVPTSRYFDERVSELYIDSVLSADQGLYKCIGYSASLQQSVEATVYLTVKSTPSFLSPSDRPYDRNVSVGDDVKVVCNAFADPPAEVTWYRNGKELSVDALPKGFQVSSDKRTLTVRNLCKTSCSIDSNSMMVVQCNATNINGYAFVNGYINVFDRTNITVPPRDVTLSRNSQWEEFECGATTDASTPLRYRWTFNGQPVGQDYDDHVTVDSTSDRSVVHIDLTSLTDGGRRYVGTWACLVTNGISSDERQAWLIDPSAALTADVWPFWWIPFAALLAVLLLLLIIIIVCCCMHRNKGEQYYVDRMEKSTGNDPEKELIDNGFKTFERKDLASCHQTGIINTCAPEVETDGDQEHMYMNSNRRS